MSERKGVLAVGEGYKSHGYDGYDGRERKEWRSILMKNLTS